MPGLALSEQRRLLQIAREAIAAAPALQPDTLPPALLRPAASFVTLRHGGDLRGCIGGLEARWPLYEDVRRHAVQAATQDYRFEAVTAAEVPALSVEVSVLTEPQPLEYARPEDLPRQLRPLVDGVTLALSHHRATFLPQVWERVPDPEQFLSMLCEKMGLPPETWRRTPLTVSVYQVEKFTEPEAKE